MLVYGMYLYDGGSEGYSMNIDDMYLYSEILQVNVGIAYTM